MLCDADRIFVATVNIDLTINVWPSADYFL